MSEEKPLGPPERHRWIFRFRVDGDVRFISHHDTLRMFRRALARTELPVRFSEGFNPAPRMSIPVPRPVGIASDDEALVVEFEKPVDSFNAKASLSEQMPDGFSIVECRRLQAGEQVQPDLVRYRIELNGETKPDLNDRANEIMAAAALPVLRAETPGVNARTLDVRPYLVELAVDSGGVEFTLRVTGSGTAKPSEIAGLLSFDPSAINHRIRRIAVIWKT